MNPVKKFKFMRSNKKSLNILKIPIWSIGFVVNFVMG